jgi:transposase
MAQLAKGQLRKKLPELEQALEGRVEEHHRFLLRMQLQRIELVETDLTALDGRITEKLEPYRSQQELLAQIPGVDRVAAATLIAEIGVDMSVFHSAGHLASWAGVCPGNHESAGKKRGGKTRKGNVHLRTALVAAAISSAKKKGSYLKDKYFRLKARRGALRAAVAVAHKILLAAYHMLRTGAAYAELGDAYLDKLAEKRVASNLVRRLERLGYAVTIAPVAQPA